MKTTASNNRMPQPVFQSCNGLTATTDKELAMLMSDRSSFLRRVLLADAATSGATGLLMLLAAGPLEPLLGLPGALLKYSGLVLLPFGALVAYVATRIELSRAAVWAVVVCNAVWTMDSIILLLSGWVAPTMPGTAFMIAQAMAVGIFAELEYFGLRRSRTIAV